MRSFETPNYFKSQLITKIKNLRNNQDQKKKDFSPSVINFGNLEILLPRHFGFCYGVENSIEIAYNAIKKEKGKRILFISEMIHNQFVNKDLKNKGIHFIQKSNGEQNIPWDKITQKDVVMIPAFGTTNEIEELLISKGINIKKYNTTCPFVEKVWKTSKKLSNQGFCSIIHGKNYHEETKATFSKASENGSAIIIKDIKEAQIIIKALKKEITEKELFTFFEGKYSKNFNLKSLEKIGVINQTTMLSNETNKIIDLFAEEIATIYGQKNLNNHFANTRNTLCYATNDNQKSAKKLLNLNPDMVLVIGGFKSSNTFNLAKICNEKINTFFIKHPKYFNENSIRFFKIDTKKETTEIIDFQKIKKIAIISGASCPDNLVELTIHKLLEIIQPKKELKEALKEFKQQHTPISVKMS